MSHPHLCLLCGINGVRLDNFSPNRGLQQVDPMSPYLFMLCMEWLSRMVSEKVEIGTWKPGRVTRGGLGISHLLFVDDIFLFVEAKTSQMRVMMKVLKDFEEVSSLVVNVEKSKAMVFGYVTRRKHEKLVVIS